MGIFRSIMDKIFHHDVAKPSAAPGGGGGSAAAPAPATASAPSPAPAPATPGAVGSSSSTSGSPAPASVDVGAVLDAMAEMKDGGGNYRSSIVDLLKLLDLDSSLAARKELADELGIHAGADGSAEQNIALHKAVMDKLAENGGLVPDSLRH